MKKKKIVIASVLKPADDVRAFEKMAMTLAGEGHQVYLVGMPSTTSVSPPNIHFIELSPFNRLSWRRLARPLRVLRKVRKVKPEVLIVNTHELLIVSFLNRILFGGKIVYDIQENYYRNILHTHAFSSWLRMPVAMWVRMKEYLFVPFFNQVILAEKCYVDELSFVPKSSTILENKSVLPPGFERRPSANKIILAFTGTLGESTGVFQAIELAEKLHEKRADIELHIMGFCALPNVLADIMSRCSGKSYIKLLAGKMQIGHSSILDLISKAHFGIISYPASPHTAGRIPTKLFEYLSARLPILLQDNSPWVGLTNRVSAAIVVDFHNPDVDRLLKDMTSKTFYTGPVDEFFWRSEEPKLIKLIEGL
ncbi:MAG TPA: hypothetical protein VFE50_11530 [Cyclobacteriaceae bacterium]|nr:hypothetical protein [Cyclobacteriaceae bacterium]